MAQEFYQMNLGDAHQYGPSNFQQFASPPWKNRYHLDDSQLAGPYPPYLPSVVADLLDIAGSIMWLDRRCLRPRTYGTFRRLRGWVRHFDITLSVREPDIWNASSVKTAIEELIYWLTEDTWELHFTHNPVGRLSEMQPPLWQPEPSDALVVLYSGGLDSLAGVVTLAKRNPEKKVVLISAMAPRLSGVLNRQVEALRHSFGADRIQYAPIHFHLIRDPEQKREEKTQRTRGFLFFACGVAQTVAYNARKLITCENGIGMLNLPFNKRQLGTQHTRSVHPHTLLSLSQLLSLLSIENISYEAPFMFSTKGEICAELRMASLGNLCPTTISCDSFAIRQRAILKNPDTELHCGKCSSCLLRRQAVFSAQIENEDAHVSYLSDVCHPGWVRDNDEDPEPLLMMLDQVTLLKNAYTSENPKNNLLLEFPELVQACSAIEQNPKIFGLTDEDSCMDSLVDLLQRYVREWDTFPYHLA